jgi:flagellar protein FlaF
MAAASLVATAFGVIIILITAYIIAAGILGLATSVAEAQKEVTALSIKASGTAIDIMESSGNETLYLVIKNKGSEPIDYTYMDVYLKDGNDMPEYFSYPPTAAKRWTKVSINPDRVYPGVWNPGENITISMNTGGKSYTWVQVTTSVGVSDSTYLPVVP